MRIALFTETFLPKVDGIVNTLCHLLDHLALRGHSSLLFAPAGGPRRYAHTPVIGLPAIPAPFYPEFMAVPPLVDVRRVLERFQPDVVHLVNPVFLGLAGLRAARQMWIPVVASYQTDLNVTPPRVTQADLEAHGFAHVKVWHRGVDTALFHPSRRNEKWRERLSAGDPARPLLLYAGRLAPEKRVETKRSAM